MPTVRTIPPESWDRDHVINSWPPSFLKHFPYETTENPQEDMVAS